MQHLGAQKSTELMQHAWENIHLEPITCGVIEHTPLGATLMENLIRQVSELELVWVCDYQENAHVYFEQYNPNIVFMNLGQLPIQISPILRPFLMYHTGIVITTGYSCRQVGNIPFPFVDYLEKPISFEKFMRSVRRYKQIQGKL